MKTNTLYFGDNLEVMRTFPDACVDLCYADPPFNSARNYFVIFKDRTGRASAAQEAAFTDTWTWSEDGESAYRDLVLGPNASLATAVQALRTILRETPMMAYLVAMAVRFVEIHRALKPTGSFYLHCDTTASHYLKILLDTVFGPLNFRNEITWKRTHAHGDSKRRFANISDTVFYYVRSDKAVFHVQHAPYSEEYLEKNYRYLDDRGRRYRLVTLRSPNPRPNLTYDYKGFKPHPNGWAVSRQKMEQLDAEGRLYFPKKPGGAIQEKYFLEEMPGVVLGDVWTDIAPISAQAKERLGYPTQKPLALLERIISASSAPGDVVLDPFCGCGTTVHAAQALGRRWVGIDVTAVSVAIIKTRLETAFDDLKGKIVVEGFPQDYESARHLFEIDPHLFQIWACTLIDAYPLTKKGADAGVDGWLNFLDLDDTPQRAVVQVKGGNLTLSQVRDFCHVVTREKASLGILLCMVDPTASMRQEAVKEGFWEDAGGHSFPKVQILPVAALLKGVLRPRYPAQDKVSMLGYKAGRSQKHGQQQEMFGD